MITREQLSEILLTHSFKQEAVQRILNKKIKKLLALGKADEIEKIFKVLDKHQINKKTIENCLSVLARGKANEIERILEVLDKHKISKEAIEGCLYVLARGKASEIEKIFKVLDKRQISKETVEGCLSVLARGKADEIERIFYILDKHQISKETVEGCLTVLALGKVDEIERIFYILDKHQISKKTVEGCLSVLARGKASEIERIFKVLDNNEVNKKTIEKNYGWIILSGANNIEKAFSETGSEYLRKYMQLRGLYNRKISKDIILDVCQKKKISIDEYIVNLIDKRGQSTEIYIDTLKHKGSLYIGKSIPIEKEDIEKYANDFLELSKRISRNFCYKYRNFNNDDIQEQAMEIILSKCGDIVWNLSENKEIMIRAIYSKVYKSLKINFRNTEILSDLSTLGRDKRHNTKPEVKKELDLSDWNITQEETEVLENLYEYIEEGYTLKESIEKCSDIMSIDSVDIYDMIESVKLKREKDRNIENNIK